MSTYIFEEEIICSDADFPPYYDDDPSKWALYAQELLYTYIVFRLSNLCPGFRYFYTPNIHHRLYSGTPKVISEKEGSKQQNL